MLASTNNSWITSGAIEKGSYLHLRNSVARASGQKIQLQDTVLFRKSLIVASSANIYFLFLSMYAGGQSPSLIINFLGGKPLKRPLSVLIEKDDNEYIARTPDLPLYGLGESKMEAIDALNREVASLYDDLMKDDDYSDEWLQIKAFLINNVSN